MKLKSLRSKTVSTDKEELERTQREHVLREQLRVIQKELGEVDPQFNETRNLEDRIRNAHMPKQVSKKALDELARLGHIPTASPENGVIRGYIDSCVRYTIISNDD